MKGFARLSTVAATAAVAALSLFVIGVPAMAAKTTIKLLIGNVAAEDLK